MRKLITLFAVAACLFTEVKAQSLYMPRNVEAAYKKGTRSMTGRPGPHYWQNHGVYDITLTAMPPNRIIRGSEKITYFNDSPDTLKEIVMSLVLNFHKPQAIHYEYFDSAWFTSGLHIDHFAIDGYAWDPGSLHWNMTWQNVKLKEPLLPGDSIHLDIDWHDEIALQSGREGMIDSTTYYIAYFYPRVAVYDDYNGWDRLDFTGYQEFYNDFNNYTLRVRVPKNFIVWATGTLENPDQVLQPKFAQRLKESMTSDDVIHIATPEDLAAKDITAQNDVNTWVWKADNVTDMAVGISDHYNWDAGSAMVDKATGRRTLMQAAYNDTAADFHHAVKVGEYTLSWLSENWPGVPFPYPKMTAFQGYADMEYPMMVNDASSNDSFFSILVENHEMAHTYFPFYMGTNESRYAFMDEGWATTFEYLIGIAEHNKEEADRFYKMFRVNRWINDPSQEEQVPIITPANIERGMAYGSNAYGKPSLAYLALKDMLGDRLFKKCLHTYMDWWHGKHPIPWDFFYSFNTASGQNLDWFWNSWFFSHGYDDLGVGKVSKTKNGYLLNVKNIGGFVIPFDVKITYTDGTTEDIHQTPIVWKKDQKQTDIVIKTRKRISSLTIDNGIWMDADERNNTWKE
ncbi:MAG: M1 family peptidase [Chitinophagaceae bacterium]|nr:MAG: M1 family peptidase [Chitinophagaceae bacterium]